MDMLECSAGRYVSYKRQSNNTKKKAGFGPSFFLFKNYIKNDVKVLTLHHI